MPGALPERVRGGWGGARNKQREQQRVQKELQARHGGQGKRRRAERGGGCASKGVQRTCVCVCVHAGIGPKVAVVVDARWVERRPKPQVKRGFE